MEERETPSYQDKTERLHAWGNVGKLTISLIWAVIVLIVLASLGKLFLFNDPEPAKAVQRLPKAEPIKPAVPWNEVDGAIAEAMQASSAEARALASKKLDHWVDALMVRVDGNFLDWYFGYWHQQVMGMQALWYEAKHWADGDQPTAAEELTQTIQEEFSTRVLRPQISQLELERITREVVDHYVEALRRNIRKIPGKYEIPVKDWERHLEDIAVMTHSIEGNRGIEVSLKALTVSTVAGTVILAKAMGPALGAIGTKVSAGMAGKAAAGMATKTGGKVAAKAGGKFLGPIIGIGIIIWDLWDHDATVKGNKPALRQGIVDYFGEMKALLLDDTDVSVMSVVYRIERNVMHSMTPEKTP